MRVTTYTILIVLSLLSGCVTGVLEIATQPSGGEVFLIDNNGARNSVGKTPFSADITRLFDRSDKGFVQISIEKEGYLPQSLIFPRTILGANHRISLTLKETEATKTLGAAPKIDQCQEITLDSMNKLSEGIAATQAAILKRDFEVALVRVSDLISRHPNIAVLYDLQGNIYFLQNQYPKALKAYQTSLKLVPSNIETAILVRRLSEYNGESAAPAH